MAVLADSRESVAVPRQGLSHMNSRLLVFIAGLLAGGILILAVDLHSEHPANTAVAPRDESESQRDAEQSHTESAEEVETPRPSEGSGNAGEHVIRFPPIDHGDIELPSSYKEMIGPLETRRPTFSERHQRFANEPRDEPWAAAMEAGINDYLATLGAERGMVFEYVECQTKTCEVAGYVVDEKYGSGGVPDELLEQPWWQGGMARSSRHFDIGGVRYFVTIIYHGERYAQ